MTGPREGVKVGGVSAKTDIKGYRAGSDVARTIVLDMGFAAAAGSANVYNCIMASAARSSGAQRIVVGKGIVRTAYAAVTIFTEVMIAVVARQAALMTAIAKAAVFRALVPASSPGRARRAATRNVLPV